VNQNTLFQAGKVCQFFLNIKRKEGKESGIAERQRESVREAERYRKRKRVLPIKPTIRE
jgi:hypothetical protein